MILKTPKIEAMMGTVSRIRQAPLNPVPLSHWSTPRHRGNIKKIEMKCAVVSLYLFSSAKASEYFE